MYYYTVIHKIDQLYSDASYENHYLEPDIEATMRLIDHAQLLEDKLCYMMRRACYFSSEPLFPRWRVDFIDAAGELEYELCRAATPEEAAKTTIGLWNIGPDDIMRVRQLQEIE